MSDLLERDERDCLVQELRDDLGRLCKDIGCSGWSPSCPGSPMCEIVRKFFPFIKTAPYLLMKELQK